MKKFLLPVIAGFLFVSCGESAQEAPEAEAPAAPEPVFASPIGYSSKFEMGNSKYSEMVAQLWKDFDDNKLDANASYFADSIVMDLPNWRFNGTRDSLLAVTKQYRNDLEGVKSSIDAIMSVKSTDVGDDWVLIWGREYITKGEKIDSSGVHEAWRFNKSGKIDWVMQFRQAYPEPQK